MPYPTPTSVASPTPYPTPWVTPEPVDGSGSLTFASEPGNWVGQGRPMTMTGPTWRFLATQYYGPDALGLMAESGLTRWNVDLAVPKGQVLGPGTYTNAQRFNTTSAPGLDVFGDGRACNSYGSFTVSKITVEAHGHLTAFEATFEQHCDSPTGPALRGTIHFEAAGVEQPADRLH